MPSITAVIPSFNRAAVIGRAIESVLRQTVIPQQLIVVDDGSTDDTPRICAGYQDHIEYIRQPNAGASAARNRGIRGARHDWIAFLDSDDYWTPEHIERMLSAIRETNGAAGLYFSDLQLPRTVGGGTLWQQLHFRPRPPYEFVTDATAWVLMKQQPTMLQTSVMSKAALLEVGGLDVDLRLKHDSYLFCQFGIGKPACAVSGIGCIQTSDDASPVRLTTAIPLASVAHEAESCLMWTKLLRSRPSLGRAYRRLVRYNLASSHWEIGRQFMRAHQYREAVGHLAKAAGTDFAMVLWTIAHRSRKGYEARVRPDECGHVFDGARTHGRA